MDNREILKKLVEYKTLVSKHFDVEKVILFGSYAKGTQRTGSDIDVAVIVNSVEDDYFTYAPLLWKLKRGIDDRIEPILFEKNKDESGFLTEVLRTGVII